MSETPIRPTLFTAHPDGVYREIPLDEVRSWFAPSPTPAEGRDTLIARLGQLEDLLVGARYDSTDDTVRMDASRYREANGALSEIKAALAAQQQEIGVEFQRAEHAEALQFAAVLEAKGARLLKEQAEAQLREARAQIETLQDAIEAFNRTDHDHNGAAMVWHDLYQEEHAMRVELEAQLRAAEARANQTFDPPAPAAHDEGLAPKCEQPERCDAEARICPQDGSTCWGMGCCVAACEARAAAKLELTKHDEGLARLEQRWRDEADRWDAAADEDPTNPMAVVARRDARSRRECADQLRALRAGTDPQGAR